MDTLTADRARTDAKAELDIGIEGMTCASCVRRVERAVAQVPGVSGVAVNLGTESARVGFDGNPATAQAVVGAIEKAGYQPAAGELDLQVDGTTCASCAGRVERALKRVPGVLEAEVNLATEKVRVQVAGVPDPGRLIEAVRQAGYVARPVAADAASGAPETAGAAARSRRDLVLVLVAVALSLPLLAGMVVHLAGKAGRVAGLLETVRLEKTITVEQRRAGA